ncbi:hypothetical protein [[Leptolyngbya] sp. PCC 7376]|uniref:DUF7925 domain-containing protein n=1 Tax=[Leptolyngbya] sp. PCC 7376 TaxID=111781 RepID=UPI0003104BB9|nr:hypothetical protein [[Leptolyngbya] sp. PCC 7376]
MRTVDNAVDGNATTPVNGEREAADTAAPLVVGTAAPDPLAVTTVLKTAISVNNNSTTTVFTDDIITYGLSLSVAGDVPTNLTGFEAANLVGTPLASLDGTAQTRILVSDAIPAGTVYSTTAVPPIPAPVAPAGWTIVYTNTPLTTAPTAATWTTAVPAGVITRIGFVLDGTVNSNTSVTGFEVSVLASGATTDAGDLDADGNTAEVRPIYNKAQVLGQTDGDPGNNVVFDESGDQSPNNFDDSDNDGDLDPPVDDDGTDSPYGDYDPTRDPEDLGDPLVDPNGNPITSLSDPDSTVPGTDADSDNNNTGEGQDGEPNKVELENPPEPPVAGNLLTGPLDQSTAVGPNNVNDDFTNAAVAEGVVTGGTVDPAVVPIRNSVRNTSGVELENVVLRPISPANANAVCASCDYVINTLLPGTTVTIFVDQDNDGVPDDANGDGNLTNDTATYNWNGTDFVLASGNTVEIEDLAIGEELDYRVDVDLPNGNAFNGYSIPLVAYVNNDGNDAFNPTTELINNVTIDNVYTGFLRLTKQAEILFANGTSSGLFDDSTTPKPQASPGDQIRYVITYENISAASSGSGNTVLTAQNLVVTENGFGAVAGDGSPANPGTDNNWAEDNDGNGEIDTSNNPGGAVATRGTIQYFNGGAVGTPPTSGTDIGGLTAAGDVTEYRNTVGNVSSGESGTFSFIRNVN